MLTNMEYNVVLEHEVLNEVAAGIVARYNRYMDKANIDDEDAKNPVALLAKDAREIKHDILRKYHTLEELAIADGRLREIRSVLERLNQENDER